MRKWEKRLSGKRISISKLIQEEAENQRPYILDWIRRQREANEDSLQWWMTHLAGRNNMSSQFFIYLTQIAAIKRWVLEQDHTSGDILVVCEDSFLLRTVCDNFKGLIRVDVPYWWKLGLLYDFMYYFVHALYTLFTQIYWFWIHVRIARKTRPKVLHKPKGEIYIIHQCLDVKAFLKPGPLSCLYFTVLPHWLESQGKKVFRLPWLFNVNLPLDQIYKRLRVSNCLIPEDWLYWQDYARALLDGFKSFSAILLGVTYNKINVNSLIRRERLIQMADGLSLSRFWRYRKALERFCQKVDKVIIISEFEMMPPEHIQVHVFRKSLGLKVKSIGYEHDIVSKDFLGYHFPYGEMKSQIFPDIIITNGRITYDILQNQGLFSKHVLIGPALRQQSYGAQPTSVNKNTQALLIMLPFLSEASVELVDKIYKLEEWIRYRLKIKVLMKPHPMMAKLSFLKNMDWTELPKDWYWCNDGIYDSLSKAHCAITTSSACVIDAIIAGVIPCTIQRELNLLWNGLDFLKDEFDTFQSIGNNQLKDRLEDIFINRRDYFKSETVRAKEYLLDGLGPIDSKTLSQFIVSV